MSVPAQPRFRVPASVVVAQVGEESILLNTASGRYYGLDPIGTSIWHALTNQPTVEQICAALLAEYDAEPDQLCADIERLLERLEACGLIASAAELSA